MKLYFSINGSKDSLVPLVLVHGFPFDHHLWDPMIPYFNKNTQVILPDLRGFGLSSTDESHYSVADMAGDIIEMMNDLDIERFAIAGHSMGGYVALQVLNQIPERISALVLVASHTYADDGDKKEQRMKTIERLAETDPAEVLAGMPNKLTNDEDVRAFCRSAIREASSIGIRGALYAMAQRESSETLWETSTVPKLVLAGGMDSFIPLAVSEKMARSGKNVIYTVFDKNGHMLMWENPAEAANAIETFMQSIRRE